MSANRNSTTAAGRKTRMRSVLAAAWVSLASVAYAQGQGQGQGQGPSPFFDGNAPRRSQLWNMNESDDPYVRLEGGGFVNQDLVKTAREIASHSTGTPEWHNPLGFEKDV